MTGDSIEIPRFGSVVQPVSVHLSNLRMASRIREILEAKELTYRLESLFYPTEGRTLGSLREGKLALADFSPSTPRSGR